MELHFLCLIILAIELAASKGELKLVHVLFVHPTKYSASIYPPDDNGVEIISGEDLVVRKSVTDIITKEEKLLIYDLGVRLRERYGTFLGGIYSSGITSTRTTDSDVSMISGYLLNAGLWPPSEEQQWLKNFIWQPVPTEYVPRIEDTLMMGRLCPAFIDATNVVRESTEIFHMEKKYHKLYSFISEETGLPISNSRDISNLYKNLKARESRNLTLPSWTKGIFPDGEMLNVTYLEDYILSKTAIQRKLNGGYLMKKILVDSATCAKDLLNEERKIMVYSGDSDLFVGLLNTLGSWHPQIPNPGSAIIFEFLENQDEQTYEMKVFQDFGKDNLISSLEIPACNITGDSGACEFSKLISLLDDSLPVDEDDLCGRRMSPIKDIEKCSEIDNAPSEAPRLSYGIFFIACSLMSICLPLINAS